MSRTKDGLPAVATNHVEERWRATLAANGRVTVPRLLCLEALHHADSHLSSREIRDRVAIDLPTIKFSTVYRTMARFLEIGLAHRVDSPQGSLFGAGTGHAHSNCTRCGRIDDVHEVDPAAVDLPGLSCDAGLAPISGLTIQFTCASCSRAIGAQPR